jgi:hypothetical protein
MNRNATVVLVAATLLVGGPARGDEVADRMFRLSSALVRLTSAVEAAVRYENVPADASDDAILALATNHDRSLLKPFERYRVRVQRQGRDAVVLVCGQKQPIRLLEDAGCSASMDRHHWKSATALPCEFTIDVVAACGTQSQATRLRP